MPKYKVKQDVQEEVIIIVFWCWSEWLHFLFPCQEYIYERLLAEKVLKEFSSSQAIYIFHENSYKEDEKMKVDTGGIVMW